MDTVQPNARVVLEYVLKDETGAVLDSSDGEGGEPIVYVHGYGMIVPGLEVALAGMHAGDEREVVVAPEAGFGERDEELLLEIDKDDFPRQNVNPGDEFVAESADGEEVVMRVVEVKDDGVVVDANHPLAGKTLRYAVRVREVSEASPDEIAEAAEAFEEAGYADAAHTTDEARTSEHTDGEKRGELVELRRKS